MSRVHFEVDPDRRYRGLQRLLRQYAKRIRKVAPSASRRKPRQRDQRLTMLVRYVKDQTGKWHDQDVATLVQAVTGKSYTTNAHTNWRKRHMATAGALR